MKNKMIYIAIAGSALLALSLFARWEYLRPNTSLADIRPASHVEAAQLLQQFSDNETAANDRFLGQVIEIRGNLMDISGGGKIPCTITLGPGPAGSSVRCLLETGIDANSYHWSKGRPVAIKGLVIGYNRDDTHLLGSDLDLTRCVPADDTAN